MSRAKGSTQVYKAPFNPTPEEIAEECAKIREGWSKDRWRKEERGRVRYSIPLAEHPRLDRS